MDCLGELDFEKWLMDDSPIELMESSLGTVPPRKLLRAIKIVLRRTYLQDLRLEILTNAMPLSDVQRGWKLPSKTRVVFTVPQTG